MKILNYRTCNLDSIVATSIVILVMFCTIIIIKLFIDGERYHQSHGCWPISFYFGDKDGCKRKIYKNIEETSKNITSKTENFQTLTSFIKQGNTNIVQYNENILSFFYHLVKEIF